MFDKVVDFLRKPVSFEVLVAAFSTSILLLAANFLPSSYLKKLHLETFLNNYNYVVLIFFFASFFLLIVRISKKIAKKRKDSAFKKYYIEQQERLFQDPEAMSILKLLYSNHPSYVRLSIYNQKVHLLEQFGLISKAGVSAVMTMDNPQFPYILQPIAEKKMKEL
ncbi:MAG: super-infection exclusion protein B [Liquorilactobacillus hordei]|uniref:super-infection exclusion protein B n=1 Tax=Liquorilactobacillus hordei TaxID=468911 RepID=UPI0039ED995C